MKSHLAPGGFSTPKESFFPTGRAAIRSSRRSSRTISSEAMTTFRRFKQYIEDLGVGLALRLDDLGTRLDAIESELAAVRSMLGERLPLDAGFVAESLGLTPAETHVAIALAKGDTVLNIAEKAGRSPNTIRWHLRQINRKLGVSTQAQLVRLVLLLPP